MCSTPPTSFVKASSFREITLSAPKCVVYFDPLSAYVVEGRDSQIYCGTLYEDGIEKHKVAVKVYHPDVEALFGAEKELKVSQITQGHEGFVRAHYFDKELSVWDWMPLGSLDKFIKKRRQSMNMEAIIVSLAKSIQYLHHSYIVHHDIKPQNILLSESESAHLIDFGDAKLNCPSQLPIEQGIGLGTLAYTAPELLSKTTHFYNPFAVDIYSFGVTAFYLLNRGRVEPWAGFLPSRAVQLILYAQKGFFAGGFNPELPHSHQFSVLIKQCLTLNPAERPSIDDLVIGFTNK